MENIFNPIISRVYQGGNNNGFPGGHFGSSGNAYANAGPKGDDVD